MEQAPGAGGGERRKNKWVSKKQVVVRSIIIISSSMSHHHHHNNNSSMAKGATATDLRPTEAQLRWAQFHHQRRSVQVRDQVQRLWQTPAFVSDVDGALSEDGNTTVSSSSFNDDPSSSSNSSHSSPSPQQRNHNNNQTTTTTKRHNNNNKKKKNKPPISRGRRALLRVSKRAYEKRREQIAAHGFVCTAGDDVDDENHHAVGQAQQRPRNQLPPASSGNTNKQRRQALQQKFLTSNEPAEDGVEAIFAEEAAWKKKRKRRHARRTVVVSDNDEERVRRFEAAFHAMMMNLSAASRQQQHPEPVISPTGNKRRWTRAVPVAVSIDGRHYDDLKWGVTFRTNSAESPTSGTGSNNPMLMAPLDRGASWMIHLPSKPKQPPRHTASVLTILEHPAPEDHPSPLIATTPSAGRMKFNALVSMLQQRTMVKSGPDLMERRVPKMRLRLGKKSQVIEPLATDKRWKKPEIMARRNNNTESTDARDVIVGMRQHDRLPGDHPDHVEFVVDNGQQHLVVMSSSSPQDSESSELRSPKYTSTGHRWTFREPSPETPESATDVFAVLRDVTTTTPKSNMGESVTDSDVYAALLNVQQGDDTPKSTEDGESNVWCQARHVVSSDSNRLFGDTDKDAKYQRLQQAQASNERARNRGSRLLLLPQQQEHGASPGKRSVGSISSSSEASPSNVKGIWRSARNAAGAALTHLSVVSMLNTTNDNNASQTGSAEKKKLSGSQAGIRNTAASSRTHQDSVRSSDSDESQFWNDVRNSGERTEQYSARAVDGHLSSSESNSRDACRRRNLPADLDAQSGGVITPSSDSESSVWRTARNTGDPKSPSSLPSIPERLASVGEATKENRQYPLNDNTVSPQSHHGRKAFKAASDRNMDKAEVAEETDDTTSVSSKGSDVWRMLRNQAKVGGRFLNIIPETKTASVDESTTCDKPADLKSSITQTAARAVDTLGGVLKMLSGKNKDAQDEAKDDEIKAVAAFRKTQDERRVFDTKSTSTSSFGMLPESIRQAVRSPNNGKEDDDHLIFEANPAQNSYEQDENDVQEYISTVNSNMSPNSSRSIDQLSPERARDIHQIVMNNSVLIGDKEAEHTIIDTDDTTSSASIDGYNPRAIASLMLSPALLTKRLHQAIRAIEKRNWVQVAYLLSANPWLAEMVDVTTSQYLLHKLALYGGGACEIDPLTGEIINIQYPPAPDQLNNDLLQMFPASVHKFDNDGNLPLHMAAASGNITMIKLLASRFPEGASVRNEEGMLPLHLLILACASPSVAKNANESPMQMVETLLGYFRGAVAVADNDGNLPLHAAAISLVGEAGVDVVYMLLDEADQQAADPFGPRFAAPSLKVQADADSASVATVETTSPTDSSHNGDDLVHCNAVRNLLGETALMAAINARAGWEIIEAIASGPGGRNAVLLYDTNRNTALHLLLNGETADPAAVLSILKIAPRAVTLRNDEGMLPIEVACMQGMPRAVIVALLLVDVPIDLDDKEGVKIIEGSGGSWWFLTCECDDQYVDVVEEIVAICSYQQIREMCFMKGGSVKDGAPVVSRATPKCREVLLRALRFVGRFEFLGNASINSDSKPGVKVFDALDFGTDKVPFADGRRVLLYCFATEDYYLEETAVRRAANLDLNFVEETFDFVVHEDGTDESPQQFCVAVESPSQTLNRIVAGMLDNPDYERKPELRQRYMIKVCLVLRQVAKSLCHLHSSGVIHADLCLENCGKFGDKWKLASTMGIQNVGKSCDPSRLGESAPPEAIELVKGNPKSTTLTRPVALKSNLEAHPSMDIWAFGKLAYEALVGEPLLDFDTTLPPKDDIKALNDIMKWNKANLKEVVEDLIAVGIPKSGIDLITHCLMPQPHKRPATMDRILVHPFWKEIQRLNASSQKSTRSRSHRRS